MSPGNKEAGGGSDAVSLLDAAADKLRDSAKWLIASFGAIGAALATGIQFSSLGALGGWDLVVALIGSALVLAGVALAIYSVADVLAPAGRTLTDIAGASNEDAARKFFQENPELLQAFKTVGDLKTAFDRDYELYVSTFAAWHRDPTAASTKKLRLVQQLGAPTAEIATNVISWANYQTLQADYRKMLYWRVVPALILVSVGLVLFILKVTSPESVTPSALPAARLQGADLGRAQLSGADLRKANLAKAKLIDADLSNTKLDGASLAGADLTGANLSGASVDGTSFLNAVWNHTTCPDGTNSDQANSSCQAHLTPNK